MAANTEKEKPTSSDPILELEAIIGTTSGETKTKTENGSSATQEFDSLSQSNNKSGVDRGEKTKKETKPLVSSSVDSTLRSSDDAGSLSGSLTKTRSIFDAFPAPEPLPPRSLDAFELEAYKDYLSMMNEIVEEDKFGRRHTKKGLSQDLLEPVITWLKKEEKAIEYNLPTLTTKSLKDGDALSDKREIFRKELHKQREAFMEHMDWNGDQYDAASFALVKVGFRCSKLAQSKPLDVSWEKIKESGMILDGPSLNAYLYACTTYGGLRGSGGLLGALGSPSESSILDILGDSETKDEIIEDEMAETGTNLPEEVATFHDILHEQTEQSLSIRVRALVTKGEPHEAEQLLNDFSAEHGVLRHRTYLPVLRLYLEQGDIASALNLFHRMRSTSTVFLEAETYVQLISGVVEQGFLSPDSEPIEGADSLGYNPASGPLLFDQLAAEMAQDVLEISSASARRLYTAFWKAFKDHDVGANLVELHPLVPLQFSNEAAKPGELVASRVTVDADTGVCPRSGVKLRLINLAEHEKKQLHDSLLELSKDAYGEFTQKWKKTEEKDDDHAAKELQKFDSWLDNRDGVPFTAIIDGANVGFYMQNFDQGKFNFHQIQFMVDALEKKGEDPLVILPYKYDQNYFHVARGSGYTKQVLDDKEKFIREELINSGKLYVVPRKCLDDFYWMLASVSDQTNSRNGADLSVESGNEEGRWAGTRPMLVSNDQMRDHRLSLLEPRLFRRWHSCHIVNYNFTAFVDDECVDDEIAFSPADFFSREIQGNPSLSNGADPEGGTAWHFPVSDWELNERFCVRIPKPK